MTEFLLYAAAAVTLPVSALVITYFVSRQLDRDLDREQFEKARRLSEGTR